eukprot:333996-Pelagomonas_calceolata.AAC.5
MHTCAHSDKHACLLRVFDRSFGGKASGHASRGLTCRICAVKIGKSVSLVEGSMAGPLAKTPHGYAPKWLSRLRVHAYERNFPVQLSCICSMNLKLLMPCPQVPACAVLQPVVEDKAHSFPRFIHTQLPVSYHVG